MSSQPPSSSSATSPSQATPEGFGDESPEIAAELSARIRFRCKACGADLFWDPKSDALSCAHCGATQVVERAEGTILERPLSEAGSAARGLGLETRTSRCGNCGATVSFGTADTAKSCCFCGSNNVLDQDARRNALRPESLIPLDVAREDVQKNFQRWLAGLWFRPDVLKRTKDFKAVGVYVPYWTFDAQLFSKWSADAGYYYYVTVPRPMMVNGRMTVRMVQERRVRWVPAWGQRDDTYDDLLVHASRGITEGLAGKLGRWDMKALVPYRPEYLAGWRAEEYQVDLEQGWQLCQKTIEAEQRARCARDVPGDTHRDLRVQNQISKVRWKHVLLPMWSLQYVYGGKTYTVLVHGQTGAVQGAAPYSWVKILLLVMGILGLLLVALLLLAAVQSF